MAKSGIIVPEANADQAIVDAVESPSPVIMTLGAVAGQALGGSNGEQAIFIEFGNRRVSVYTAGSAEVSAAIEAATKYEEFVQDVPGRVTEWTASKASPLAPVANQTSKVARSMPALISAIEDFAVANPTSPIHHIWVDQVTGKVSVFDVTGGIAVLNAITTASAAAAFDQTVTAVTGTVKNAFE